MLLLRFGVDAGLVIGGFCGGLCFVLVLLEFNCGFI